MLFQQTEKGEIVERYLNKYPDMSSWGIAKLVYSNHEDIFKNIDSARSSVRYYRGSLGMTPLSGTKGGKAGTHKIVAKSHVEDWDKYIVPIAYNNILVIGDIHIPYHDEEALTAALDWGLEHNVNCIILNGDIVDFYQISRFIKSPRNTTVKVELEMLREFLNNLRAMFPNAKIIYKEGNHEKRLETYMRSNAKELYDVLDYKLPDLINFAELCIDYVENERIIMAGRVNIIHGHEVPGNRQARVAYQIFQRTQENTIVGHSHVADKFIVSTINDSLRGAWAVPCLCDLHPEYARINRWTHGFLRLHIIDENKFKVFQGEIHNGQVL